METLYREHLMELIKNPLNKGKLQNPSAVSMVLNPLCGDEISLQLKIENGRAADAKFDGTACGICVASSSLLTEEIKGKTITELKSFTKEKLMAMLGVNLTTSRGKCAQLPMDALKLAIIDYEGKS